MTSLRAYHHPGGFARKSRPPVGQTALSIAVVVRHGAEADPVVLVDHVPEINFLSREQFLPAMQAGPAMRVLCRRYFVWISVSGSLGVPAECLRKWMEAVRHCRESKRQSHTGSTAVRWEGTSTDGEPLEQR